MENLIFTTFYHYDSEHVLNYILLKKTLNFM